MTVNDTERVRAVARKITESSSAAVQADIEEMQARELKPEWVQDATRALQVRTDPVRASQPVGPVFEGVAPPEPDARPSSIGVDETIVFAVGTPVFLVKDNAVDIASARSEVKAWKEILTKNAANVNRMMASIGRVDVQNFDTEYLGTAWVIDDGLVVTNRHVANYFAESSGVGFKFRLGFDARSPIGVNVDFLEEFGNDANDEVAIERVVWIAPENQPDVAFLKLAEPSGPVGRIQLELSDEPPPAKLPVAVIGYPFRDWRFSDRELAEKIFGGVFDKKRLAVGNLLAAGGDLVTHSCATLGGNSGSPLVDIATGRVVGLHSRGVEFIENDAVSTGAIRKCLKRANVVLDQGRESFMVSDGSDVTKSGGGVTFTIPLRITVEIDASGVGSSMNLASPQPFAAGGGADGSQSQYTGPPDRQKVLDAVRTARALLGNRDDVVAIKPGWRFECGEITDERAVVISVNRKVDAAALDSRGITPLPTVIDGVRVDVTVASTADLLAATSGLATEEAPPNWRTNYKKRPDLKLERRKAVMGFVIHSSPDCGWPQLGAFLAKTRKSLTIAMYDFGARNVVQGVLDAVKGPSETIAMVLELGGPVHEGDFTDREVVAKIRDAKKQKFLFAPASVGRDGIFFSDYHIKVAVRDHASFWLSSGNWQVSNQPDIEPLTNDDDAKVALRNHNREWHAILDDKVLADLYEKHILRDLEEAQAVEEAVAPTQQMYVLVPADMEMGLFEAAPKKPQYFEPLVGKRELDVQPILTPDNYIEQVLPFIKSATASVHVQNQSFNTKTVGPDYKRLLDALLEKHDAGLDVKIIFRSFGSDDRDVISNAKDYGFTRPDCIRKQRNCHTKGIVIDGESVLLGSHNWTTAGTKFNRDASLIFYDSEIAQFYEKMFTYDWNRVGPLKIDESLPPPVLVSPGEEATPRPGYIAVPLSDLLDR